jgi:hypothetical protein
MPRGLALLCTGRGVDRKPLRASSTGWRAIVWSVSSTPARRCSALLCCLRLAPRSTALAAATPLENETSQQSVTVPRRVPGRQLTPSGMCWSRIVLLTTHSWHVLRALQRHAPSHAEGPGRLPRLAEIMRGCAYRIVHRGHASYREMGHSRSRFKRERGAARRASAGAVDVLCIAAWDNTTCDRWMRAFALSSTPGQKTSGLSLKSPVFPFESWPPSLSRALECSAFRRVLNHWMFSQRLSSCRCALPSQRTAVM